MLHAILYARFHPRRGPSIVHQFPIDSIVAAQSNDILLPIRFSEISPYVIPPYELCNRPLAFCTNRVRILGFPISLEDPKYDRNRFTFNTCFVLDEAHDARPWIPLVKKLAEFFRTIEVQDGMLQTEETLAGLTWADAHNYPAAGIGFVYSFLQRIFEDLNERGESCARIDKTNVLNLRLFNPRAVPSKVQLWDVPLVIRSLPDPEEWTWDLALVRIRPYIDGINHVQRIATLASVEVRLVKRAIRELIYHERVTILDIFHFGAIYMTTGGLSDLVHSEAAQDECRNYVYLELSKQPLHKLDGDARRAVSSANTEDMIKSESTVPSRIAILALYASLSQGITVHDFVLTHQHDLANIDIRRFITFGVIKGFVRRVHKYALATVSTRRDATDKPGSVIGSQSPSKLHARTREDRVMRDLDRAWKLAALSSGWATPPTSQTALTSASGSPSIVGSLGRSAKSTEEARAIEDARLRPYLDGKCCFDQIAIELGTSERKIIERLRSDRFDNVVVFCR